VLDTDEAAARWTKGDLLRLIRSYTNEGSKYLYKVLDSAVCSYVQFKSPITEWLPETKKEGTYRQMLDAFKDRALTPLLPQGSILFRGYGESEPAWLRDPFQRVGDVTFRRRVASTSWHPAEAAEFATTPEGGGWFGSSNVVYAVLRMADDQTAAIVVQPLTAYDWTFLRQTSADNWHECELILQPYVYMRLTHRHEYASGEAYGKTFISWQSKFEVRHYDVWPATEADKTHVAHLSTQTPTAWGGEHRWSRDRTQLLELTYDRKWLVMPTDASIYSASLPQLVRWWNLERPLVETIEEKKERKRIAVVEVPSVQVLSHLVRFSGYNGTVMGPMMVYQVSFPDDDAPTNIAFLEPIWAFVHAMNDDRFVAAPSVRLHFVCLTAGSDVHIYLDEEQESKFLSSSSVQSVARFQWMEMHVPPVFGPTQTIEKEPVWHLAYTLACSATRKAFEASFVQTISRLQIDDWMHKEKVKTQQNPDRTALDALYAYGGGLAC
jgi:hypothetical protein